MEKNFIPQAALCLTNHGGIAIQLNDNNDMVRYQWFDNKPSRWQSIKYNKEGEPFFRVRNTIYLIKDFIKI